MTPNKTTTVTLRATTVAITPVVLLVAFVAVQFYVQSAAALLAMPLAQRMRTGPQPRAGARPETAQVA